MKKLITALITATVLILGGITFAQSNDQQEDHCQIEDIHTYAYYNIVLIDDYYYHAYNIQDDSELLFTSEYILSGQEIKEGDMIVAVFENDNTIDGLVAVEKVK